MNLANPAVVAYITARVLDLTIPVYDVRPTPSIPFSDDETAVIHAIHRLPDDRYHLSMNHFDWESAQNDYTAFPSLDSIYRACAHASSCADFEFFDPIDPNSSTELSDNFDFADDTMIAYIVVSVPI